MNFLDLRNEFSALIELGGWGGSNPAPLPDVEINKALKRWTEETQYNVADVVVTTKANQAIYQLPVPTPEQEWILIFNDVQWNVNSNPFSPGWIPQGTLEVLRQTDPQWRTTPASTPLYWYWTGQSNTIGFWPMPSQDDIAMSLEGVITPPPLVNDEDVPNFNSTYHVALAEFAAYNWGRRFTRGAERNIAFDYEQSALQWAAKFRGSLAARDGNSIQRRVERARPEYQPNSSTVVLPLWQIGPVWTGPSNP